MAHYANDCWDADSSDDTGTDGGGVDTEYFIDLPVQTGDRNDGQQKGKSD